MVPARDESVAGAVTELAVGSEFAGRYLVERQLGRGGMGAVYRVVDRALGEPVALKVMSEPLDEQAVERFRREVRLARRITHTNVARTYDLGVHNGLHYLTMELLSGPTLRQLLRKEKRLPLETARRVAADLCAGLEAAHAAGVIHRDLKPQNVVIEPSGRTVILDFGIAHSSHDPRQTAGVVGTPAYMAPEQLGRGEPDARVDLYAVGILLHEMLSGQLPTWAGSRKDVFARLDAKPVLSLEGFPDSIVTLTRTLLSTDPGDRPGHARQVADTLRAAREAPTLVDGPAPDTVRFAPLPSQGRVLAVVPFRERGAELQLGVELAEELVDVLSRVAGLDVLASRATVGLSPPITADRARQELGAELVVEGTVQRSGSRMRTTARLIEAESGYQIWSERFDGEVGDVFAFVDQTARRIAEALRLELSVARHTGSASTEAIELYLEGNRRRRALDTSGYDLLDRAVKLAPELGPAIAARALAAVRRGYLRGSDEAFGEEVAFAVSEALGKNPEAPETRLAAAMLAAQEADYATAARLLRQAVTVAPTFADAQEYLGVLQLEAGRTDEGVKRLEHAAALDPLATLGVSMLWRHHMLHGREQQCIAAFAELERRSGRKGPTFAWTWARSAIWARDRDELARVLAWIGEPSSLPGRVLHAFASAALGTEEPQIRSALEAFPRVTAQPRFATLMHQVSAEAWAAAGRPELALDHVRRAASLALVDLEWLDLFPFFEPIRKSSEFAVAARRVRERAAAIWML